jgi:hypothetical protein
MRQDNDFYVTIRRLISAVVGLDKEDTASKREFMFRMAFLGWGIYRNGFNASLPHTTNVPIGQRYLNPTTPSSRASPYLLVESHPLAVPFCFTFALLSCLQALLPLKKLTAMSKEASDVIEEDNLTARIANDDLNRKKKQVCSHRFY